MIFSGVSRDGQVQLFDAAGYHKQVRRLDGKRIDLELRQHREKRSPQANRFFHGPVIDAMMGATGYEDYECKEILKGLFLRAERDGREYVRPTSSLDVQEFAEFVDQCIRWLVVEFGCRFEDWRAWQG